MDLLEIMKKRRSVRKYTDESIDEAKLERILQAALLSASGRAKRPWNFIVVRDKEMLEKLSHCRDHGAAMLKDADSAVVVIGDAKLSDTWIEDCSIAMANMYLMADSLGVGCCWIQGRGRVAEDGSETENYVKALLNFPDNFRLAAIMSLGMPAEHGDAYDLNQLNWEKVRRY